MGERRRAWESGSFENHSGGSESRELAGEEECRGQIIWWGQKAELQGYLALRIETLGGVKDP